MSKLKIQTAIIAFKDTENASAPKKKAIDWLSMAELECESVFSDHFELAANAEKSISEAAAGEWALGAGIALEPHPTNSALVIVRAALFDAPNIGVAEEHVVTTSPDGTITVSRTTPFENYVRGTRIGIRGPMESGPFSEMNEGMWEVVRKTAMNAIVLRRVGDGAYGAAETAMASEDSLYLIGAPGEYGTKLYISGGAAFGVGGVFDIVEQGDGFASIAAPDASTGLSFTGDLGIALDALSYIRIESDRPLDVSISVKGAAVVIPLFPVKEGERSGWFEYRGPFGAITVKNLSGEVANISFVYGLEKAK